MHFIQKNNVNIRQNNEKYIGGGGKVLTDLVNWCIVKLI